MKLLYLVRHAKSSWENPELYDEERPLLRKGIQKTKLICDFLKDKDIRVEKMISSHTVRAFETARIIASSMDYPEDSIIKDERLYEEGIQGYYDVISGLPDHIDSVMLFGHNPSITSFVNRFVNDKIDSLATSGVVCICFDMDTWEEIDMARSTLKFNTCPKLLK